jgi:predicted membrane protein
VVDAHRFCFTITIVNLIPYIIMALFVFYSITIAISLPFILLQSLFEVGLQALAYVHMVASSSFKKKNLNIVPDSKKS